MGHISITQNQPWRLKRVNSKVNKVYIQHLTITIGAPASPPSSSSSSLSSLFSPLGMKPLKSPPSSDCSTRSNWEKNFTKQFKYLLFGFFLSFFKTIYIFLPNLPPWICPGAKFEVTILVVKWEPGDVDLGKEQIIFNLKKQVMSTLEKNKLFSI